jgi:hypothetical protein
MPPGVDLDGARHTTSIVTIIREVMVTRLRDEWLPAFARSYVPRSLRTRSCEDRGSLVERKRSHNFRVPRRAWASMEGFMSLPEMRCVSTRVRSDTTGSIAVCYSPGPRIGAAGKPVGLAGFAWPVLDRQAVGVAEAVLVHEDVVAGGGQGFAH